MSGCGGGGGDFKNDPRASGRAASVNVTGAVDTSLNGLYATNDVFLNDVEKINPIGGDPETCRFRFSNLPKAGSAQIMDGEIRYIPGTNEARVSIVSISTIEFRLLGTAGATVDRANNLIDFQQRGVDVDAGRGPDHHAERLHPDPRRKQARRLLITR